MIVGGYTLHLYCDCAECSAEQWRRKYNGGFGEFVGRRHSQTIAQARKQGWRIGRGELEAFAPGHDQKKTRDG